MFVGWYLVLKNTKNMKFLFENLIINMIFMSTNAFLKCFKLFLHKFSQTIFKPIAVNLVLSTPL